MAFGGGVVCTESCPPAVHENSQAGGTSMHEHRGKLHSQLGCVELRIPGSRCYDEINIYRLHNCISLHNSIPVLLHTEEGMNLFMVTSVPASLTQCKLYMAYAVRLGSQTLNSSPWAKASPAALNKTVTLSVTLPLYQFPSSLVNRTLPPYFCHSEAF